MFVLGKIIGGNGLKFSFTTNGFKQGMIVQAPFLLMIFTIPLILIGTPEISLNVSNAVPGLISRAIFDIGNAVWEEVLWRGVLMTGFLIKLSSTWDEKETVRKRVIFMIACSFAFGLIHIGGGVLHFLSAAILGTMLSAAYIYSRNLLACTIIHFAINYISNGVFRMFYDAEVAMVFVQRFWVVNIILGSIIILPIAIYLTIKAKPFYLDI